MEQNRPFRLRIQRSDGVLIGQLLLVVITLGIAYLVFWLRNIATTYHITTQRIRIERGVSYHGIALNVSVDLRDFDLIDPCGMPGLTSASVWSELDRRGEPPSTGSVAEAARVFAPSFAARIGAPLAGTLP